MNVLHLVWNLIRGGTEGQCARVAMELSRRGQTHRIIVFRREGYFLPFVEKTCGPVEEIGIHGMFKRETFYAIRHLAQRIKQDHVEIVHAWDADAAIFGQFAADLAGVPLITSRRDLGQIYPIHKRWLMRRADQHAVCVVANARAIKDVFVAQGVPGQNIRVIPNILDSEELDHQAGNPFSRSAELPDGDRVVMVCRLDPEKDVATFVRAAGMVAKQSPDAAFVIAGDGVDRIRLEAMCRDLQMTDRMVFLGDTTEVPALLKSCSIGVLTPSRNEGLSNTILEYMAASLPVVATECGGNRELVNPPVGGTIVPVGDANGLAEALLNLLKNPALRRTMGDANRKAIETIYRPDAVGDRFEALYREVLN
ncbi:MAG TPA: glycosyltransferase [Kiritimatiellia bacterium]|nr:glycosyltransferase [Kiritimatiellia bacterium]